jgi:GNAT superfamily N-acetyltransferase
LTGPVLAIRALEPSDLPAALALQAAVYPAFLVEPEDAFVSRLRLSGSYCLAALSGAVLVAYLLAHGWRSESPPPVGAMLSDGGASDVLFIHDLAVSPAGRGTGVGRALVDRAFAAAARDGLTRAELIAVEGAASFWQRLGFVEAGGPTALRAKVAAYGPDARWMTRLLA